MIAGDVWIASGQSNMEFAVSGAHNAAETIASANDPMIRHFGVPHAFSEQPAEDIAGGSWAAADPAHVGSFTAVGYFFAREVRKSVNVPIALLHTSWGGSNIETWLSREALGMSPEAGSDSWPLSERGPTRCDNAIRDQGGCTVLRSTAGW